jgi:multicomponent Na+:H+ antiporter subunit E
MLFVLWLALTLGNPVDLPAGVLTAIAATWTSLYLLSPSATRLSPPALVAFAQRFFRLSIVAGVDVAWRALDPRLPLRPGYVVYQSQLPEGRARNTFCTLASLLPGTLPADRDRSGALVIHCLDIDQPVTAQLAEDEDLFRRALGEERDDG